ncbi:MAG: hypothetical protein L0Z50_38190 [Verrucomicrobiales bacterium]|nr:hypothetical protein [Verrucomicrobiales bacterium]
MAKDIAWLLSNPGFGSTPGIIREKYLELLADQGFATWNGYVRLRKLSETIADRYSRALLKVFQCPVDSGGERAWLARLVRKPRGSQSPIRHLLLIDFLGYSAERVFSNLDRHAPFGNGPWPCLNPVCIHWRKPRIKVVMIGHNHDHKCPVGTFRCPKCQYSYRSLRTRLPQSRTWVKDYGQLWRDCLVELWNKPSMSLREVADLLGVDPITVKRHAAKAKLIFPRVGKRISTLPRALRLRRGMSVRKPLNERRSSWISLVAKHNSSGIKLLRQRSSALYAWLYRNDRVWLQKHLPPPRPRAIQSSLRAEWAARDADLVSKVGGVALKLKAEYDRRPKQVTMTSIGKKLGTLAYFHKHLDKLPRTNQRLRDVVETREDFAERRIRNVTEYFRAKRILPKRWELVRAAGLRPALADSPPVRVAITGALKKLEVNAISNGTTSPRTANTFVRIGGSRLPNQK